jgi:hypothetical protein
MCPNTDLALEPDFPGVVARPLAERVQDVGHRGDVEQVVVEHRHQAPRVAVADVVVIEARDLFARHIADAAAAADAPLERGEAAVGQFLAPLPARVVEQATESVRLANARYNAGTGTQLDVLASQVDLTTARNNQLQAYYGYNVAVAALRKAMGLADEFVKN